MKKIILNVALVVCMILTIIMVSQNADKTIQNKETARIDDTPQTTSLSGADNELESIIDQVTAYNYKLYYGTWMIESLAQVNFHSGPLIDHEELIGEEFTMNHEQITMNGQVLSNAPRYSTVIIPENQLAYIPFLPSQKDLELDDAYFTYITVRGIERNVDTPTAISKSYSFFIKDDSTLFLLYNNSCYKLSRTSYMENYESLVNSSLLTIEDNYDEDSWDYKLYHGIWMVDSIVEVNSDFKSDNKNVKINAKIFDKELLGSEITMEMDQILINDRLLTRQPNYIIAIIPNTLESYIEELPTQSELGLDKSYYVYVTVGTSDLSMELDVPYSFFIKDDTTLYMLYNNCFYKLCRKEHIDNYEMYYHPI